MNRLFGRDSFMTQTELARSLRPGDEVTTTLGRAVVVGGIHADETHPGSWWIEPLGAADHEWWLPVQNVVRVNGQDVSPKSS